MPKRQFAIAAVLAGILIVSCSSQEATTAENGAVGAEANAVGNASPSDPGQPGTPVNGVDAPVPPPDAVSHPDGYLPPVPGEPDPTTGNSSGPGATPPAIEDEYMRNKQAGR